MTSIPQALISLRPGASWNLVGDTYEGLEWLEKPPTEGGQDQPTEKEVEEEIVRLQKEYEYYQYQRERAKAYPSIPDQLDILYHQGYEGWKKEIEKIKQQFPKPE